MVESPAFLKLSCAVQNYAWGKVGEESEVARLKGGDPAFTVDPKLPYAELWMGTHMKAPSVISHPQELSGQLLSDWLKTNQWALGEKVAKEFNGQLPFLFKVLSINKALSIQAHPTKSHAEQLHKMAPDKYPDPNHKPEMLIVLKDFEGFCGFRPFDEIRRFLSSVPELQAVVGQECVEMVSKLPSDGTTEEDRKAALRRVFTAVMTCEMEVIKSQLSQLVERLQKSNTDSLPSQECSLVLRLNGQFPGDVGCFCVFFLNYLRLQPGECLFLAPNEPHAYLYGEIVECMACSDNVVRAGLTPKYRDKEALCQMLTYNCRTAAENKFPHKKHPTAPHISIYDPPTPEFAVGRISLPAGLTEFTLPPIPGPSLLLVLSDSLELACNGLTDKLHRGSVVFLPSEREAKFYPKVEEKETLLFQAYCSL